MTQRNHDPAPTIAPAWPPDTRTMTAKLRLGEKLTRAEISAWYAGLPPAQQKIAWALLQATRPQRDPTRS